MVWRKQMTPISHFTEPGDQSSDPDTIVVPVARSFWVSPTLRSLGVLAG